MAGCEARAGALRRPIKTPSAGLGRPSRQVQLEISRVPFNARLAARPSGCRELPLTLRRRRPPASGAKGMVCRGQLTGGAPWSWVGPCCGQTRSLEWPRCLFVMIEKLQPVGETSVYTGRLSGVRAFCLPACPTSQEWLSWQPECHPCVPVPTDPQVAFSACPFPWDGPCSSTRAASAASSLSVLSVASSPAFHHLGENKAFAVLGISSLAD